MFPGEKKRGMEEKEFDIDHNEFFYYFTVEFHEYRKFISFALNKCYFLLLQKTKKTIRTRLTKSGTRLSQQQQKNGAMQFSYLYFCVHKKPFE